MTLWGLTGILFSLNGNKDSDLATLCTLTTDIVINKCHGLKCHSFFQITLMTGFNDIVYINNRDLMTLSLINVVNVI